MSGSIHTELEPGSGLSATLGEAAAAMGATLHGDAAVRFARVTTDSRKAGRGDLFVCLVGANFDAHDFASAALEAGAAAVVCARGRGPARASGAVLEVDDTLVALGDLAAWHRRAFHGPVIGVTGSNGKTTTKEMLRAILLARFGEGAVLATAGNLNNLIGVPLTLFRLETDRHLAAVIEMGMNAPGEIARMAAIAAPTVGLITCVAEAHLEGLGSIEGVARAKGELFEGLPAGAVAVVNIDDANVAAQALRFEGRHLTFGVEGELWVRDVACDRIDGSRFELVHGEDSVAVDLPLPGRHNVQNALGAAAAALAAGVPLATIGAGLSSMEPPPMRFSAETLANGVTLVNDAYNANPGSLAAALATLGGLDTRRIVVLGDMLELGEQSAALHRRAGEQAAAIDPLLVCAVGAFAADVAEGAESAGLDPARMRVCAGHEAAAAQVAGAWLPGDAVLVKGSRGSAMEKVAEILRPLAAQGAAGVGAAAREGRDAK